MKSLSLLLFSLSASILSVYAKPNILFIMSDDHAAHAVSAYGGRLAEVAPTPNIDRLAKEGALLSNAFCTNSICSPSRACILTGQYPHRNGVTDLIGKVDPGKQALAIAMKQAGYHTAMIGKWHLKTEPADFDYYNVLRGQGHYFNPELFTRGPGKYGENSTVYEGKHSTDVITDVTLNWLKEDWDQEKPFFLMHHYKAPHDFFENAPRYQSYLADIDIPAPETLYKRSPMWGSIATRGHQDELLPYVGTSIGTRHYHRHYLRDLTKLFPEEFPGGVDFQPTNYKEDELKRFSYNAYLKKFLRCVKGIDDNLGRLFAHLEATNQLDNTLIIYTGDQGFMLGEHDYQDKRWMYEESMRMPFLVRYPKAIPAGQKIDAIVENVDYGPTMLDFAGAKVPTSMQGQSFKTILETGKESESWKKSAYYRYWMHMTHHYNPAHLGIRTKTHKLIYYYGCSYGGPEDNLFYGKKPVNYKNQTPPAWELYDLVNDPFETTNLYHNPAHAQLVVNLKEQLKELRKRVGDDGSHFPKSEEIIQKYWDYSKEDQAEAILISHRYLDSVKKKD